MQLTEDEKILIAKFEEFGLTGIKILNYKDKDFEILKGLIRKIRESEKET